MLLLVQRFDLTFFFYFQLFLVVGLNKAQVIKRNLKKKKKTEFLFFGSLTEKEHLLTTHNINTTQHNTTQGHLFTMLSRTLIGPLRLRPSLRSIQHINLQQQRGLARKSSGRKGRSVLSGSNTTQHNTREEAASAAPPPPALRPEEAWVPVVDEASQQTVCAVLCRVVIYALSCFVLCVVLCCVVLCCVVL